MGPFRVNARSRSVSVFLKSGVTGKLFTQHSVCDETLESCALDLSVRNLSFVLLAIYRPCSGNVDQFCDRVTSILSSNRIKRRLVVVAGDININLLNAEDNNVLNFLGSMRSLFLIPTIRHPTRFSPTDVTVATCLDHIWINHSQWNTSGILYHSVTDHCPSFVYLDCAVTENPIDKNYKVRFRLENETSLDRFKSCVANKCWDQFLCITDVNISTNEFISCIDDLYCKSIPLVTKQISYERLHKPWIDGPLINLLRRKSEFFLSLQI